jgi:hypothetical protein
VDATTFQIIPEYSAPHGLGKYDIGSEGVGQIQLQITDFWDVTQIITEISQELAACIFRF